MSRIRIEAATKRFGGVTAVDEVTLDVAHGEFLVLLGPSGCGKSTLLRAVAGLTPLSAGRVLLDDRDITHAPPRDRDLAMVFQSYALYPHLSVEKNMGFPLRARGRARAEIRSAVREVATALELDELLDRRPRELSGGQRQRVALGRALVRDPGAFLMDEPLSNLDAKLRTATRAGLTELHRSLGSTFLYVTHDQVEAMTMATRIAVLHAGRLEQVGTPAEVYDEPASAFVAGFLGAPAMNLLPARVTSRDGRLYAVARDVEVPLDVTGEQPDVDVLLGVRPEHLVPAGSDAQLRGVVGLVENLGSEELAHCTVGDTSVCVRGTRPLGVTTGAAIGLSTCAATVHLFDRASGRRLVWREPASAAGRRLSHLDMSGV
ncbi:ABC transporter ATP-binding protein [Pseudonocardia abyssalis]|uniref:Sn-glycerol-3-phosphate ABC transporter ATP-binding protein UgpC n=1 Tax=Pseudonocardia abyssalis TaxID=2792008 RepID=A0ABS6UNP4_9PSEU|nr:sn-glycerol-3-phosphate ABC transporter ATP-binding protein UgpC [Pseudonocardia abyssalis]MBW0116042.1 sn-glycerol-3-phosphate ABC transporter ATP-binding protein UgpC [Pseudonocardia abyssalis]MBW0133878.1 sn-glycerol-3-phosphate ABC transporter ATP-binding protein UgpC [Pseudonocardia abyssalis]